MCFSYVFYMKIICISIQHKIEREILYKTSARQRIYRNIKIPFFLLPFAETIVVTTNYSAKLGVLGQTTDSSIQASSTIVRGC